QGVQVLVLHTTILDALFTFPDTPSDTGLTRLDDDKRITAARVWSDDGSLASLRPDATVTETGPRLIWGTLEDAHRIYTDTLEPGPDRYGITVAPDGQRVWLDTPDGPSWALHPLKNVIPAPAH
ncbi:hypothetical protein ACFVRE_42635, partial [Streptomyces sp. NPDC057910]